MSTSNARWLGSMAATSSRMRYAETRSYSSRSGSLGALLKQLRTCDPDLPFIMITGLANYEAVAEAKSYGVTGYIKKPFSVDQLKKKLGLVSRIILHRRNEQAIAASKSY